MRKFSISKEFRFEAAHRLVAPYNGKCASLHGHSWVVTVWIESHELNPCGFVRDFSDLQPIRLWIDGNLDHATLVGAQDSKLLEFLRASQQKHFIIEGNPTSELIAKTIFEQAEKLGFAPTKVEVAETCTCRAAYHAGD